MDDQFGLSVAISGTTAIVGALFDDDNGVESGSASLYRSPSDPVAPVPLPAGAWLLLSGLAALGLARRAGLRA